MSCSVRKLIAVFMLLWLPLSAGSALAASLAMQMQAGGCHESATMAQHGNQTTPADPASACASCSVCHLACSGFTLVKPHVVALVATTAQIVTFMPEIFISHVSVPLLPPPLARA